VKVCKRKASRQHRRDNSAWTSKSGKKRRAGKGNILPARCDTAQYVRSKAHKKTKFKSSFQVNMDEVELTQPLTTAEIVTKLAANLKEPSFRPLQSVVYDLNGSPIYGKTPGGSKLYKDRRYNALYAFSNRESAKESFEHSTQYQEMTDFVTAVKTKRIEITEAHQKRVLRERAKDNFKRRKSQKAVMGESAAEHMGKIDVTINDVKFEWAHLVAHAIAGAASQDKTNLVAVPNHLNTEMIFPESDIPLLVKHYPDGFTLVVTAYLLNDSHAATSIEYKIITPDFQKTYVFDAQHSEQPHLAFKSYFHSLTKALILDSEPSPENNTKIGKRPRTKAPKVSEQNFFSKKNKVLEQDENAPVDTSSRKRALFK